MQEQKRVHNSELQNFEVGCELTEEELAAVCGGVGAGNEGDLNPLGDLGGLGSGLGAQPNGIPGSNPGSNQANGAGNLGSSLPLLGSLPGLDSLQNVLGGLGGLGGL